MAEGTIETAGVDFKDRRTGLILFGVVGILIGAFKLLSSGTMLLAYLIVGTMETGAELEFSTRYAPVNFTYQLAGAVAWIWLGIGSIRARRWARALLLIYSWVWLLAGAGAMIFMTVLLPGMMQRMPEMPSGDPAIASAVMVVMTVTMGFFMVVLPAIFILFYQSRHVKATCEWRDPTPRWTDRCPLPVLAMSLWYLFGALMMPIGPAMTGVFPLFGFYLEGVPAVAAVLVMLGLWVWQAYGLYRLDRNAWRVSLATTIVFGVSTIGTFAKSDLLEVYYSRMDLSERHLEMMRTSGLFEGQTFMWLIAVPAALWIAGLIWIRRYFPDPAA